MDGGVDTTACVEHKSSGWTWCVWQSPLPMACFCLLLLPKSPFPGLPVLSSIAPPVEVLLLSHSSLLEDTERIGLLSLSLSAGTLT